jgi:hypothetical protein
MGGELWPPAHRNAARFCAFAPLAGAAPDQFALEFRQARQDREHKAPVRGGRVRPGVAYRLEPGADVAYGRNCVQQIAGGPCQPVQPSNEQHIARAKRPSFWIVKKRLGLHVLAFEKAAR